MTSTIKVDTISENTSANGVAVDGVTLKDGGIAATDGSTITTADNTDTLTLTSTDADANIGPNLLFYRNSSSPADADQLGNVKFKGRNDNSEDVTYAEFVCQIKDASDGTEDSRFGIFTMVAGTETSRFEALPTESVFNQNSADINFRVESNNNENMFNVQGADRVGIGSIADLGDGLHIRKADSGASVSADADDLVIEEGTSGQGAGMTILNAVNGFGFINFGDSDSNNRGQIVFGHPTDNMVFNTGGGTSFSCIGTGQLSTKGEAAPDVSAGGLCIQQAGNDTNILTFKSSDVAHGITNTAETDTYFEMKKQSASAGGVAQTSYSEQKLAHAFEGFVGLAEESSPSAASFGPFYFNASIKSGTGIAEMSASQHLFAVANDGDAKFMIDGDGTFHSDGAGGTYDTYEDAQLVRAFDLSHMEGVINSKFDKFVQYNHEDLAAAKLVGREPDGTPNHFINYPAFNRLHNGAIWQQYEKTERLANAVYELAKAAVGEEKANEILEQNEIKLLN